MVKGFPTGFAARRGSGLGLGVPGFEPGVKFCVLVFGDVGFEVCH